MDRRLIELHVQNFRSLRNVTIPLGPVNVLVGPNGAGKTNVLEVFRFLADATHENLECAFDTRGGYRDVVFRDGGPEPLVSSVCLKGFWTSNSSESALDEYNPTLRPVPDYVYYREILRFKHLKGRGKRLTLNLSAHSFRSGMRFDMSSECLMAVSIWLRDGLLRGNADAQVDAAEFTDWLGSLRYVAADADPADDARAALLARRADGSDWQLLVEDARTLLPQLESIDVEKSPDSHEDQVVLHERGLRHPTALADASAGTVRLLGLLAMFYDPEPPVLTCVDGIERGMHPQALELLMERMREASERTQFLVTTCSPSLLDRLRPEELIICERDDDGSSRIPAVSTDEVRKIVAASEGLPLGTLWSCGAMGGDL